MKQSILCFIMIFIYCYPGHTTYAQINDSIKSSNPDSVIIKDELNKRYGESQKFLPADEMPQPIGGMQNLTSKLDYTDEAILNKIEGRLLIQFIVTKDSTVENIRVIKGLGYGLDEIGVEAIRTTKFKPGLVDGKPVNVETTIPLVFKLR